MSCSNCFNGCVEITSDKCVRYTGEDVPELGISTGDTLLSVENSIIQYLIEALAQVNPVIPADDICNIVQSNLPQVGPYTLDDYLISVIKSLCQINDRLVVLESQNSNTEYNLLCLSTDESADNSNTHYVLQLVITRLCTLITDQSAFEDFVAATYVPISDINTYIENYINTQPTEQLISNRMVPYSITGYAGPLSNFSGSGSGIGDWEKIYLCNGQNGTPDLRGRVLIGTNDGSMGGGALPPSVDPAVSGNPTYGLNTTRGSNQETLQQGQIPSHTHTATALVNDPGHSHDYLSNGGIVNLNTTNPPTPPGPNSNGGFTGGDDTINVSATEPAFTGIDVSVTVNSTGGTGAHDNYQPGTGVYYIIYIP